MQKPSEETVILDGQRCLMVAAGILNSSGGIAEVSRLALRVFSQQKYSVDALVLNETEASTDAGQAYSCPLTYRTFGGNKLAFTLVVWQVLLQHRYDIVFADHVNIAAILAPMSLLRRCRYIVWLHGIEVFAPKPDLEGYIGLRFASKRLPARHTRSNRWSAGSLIYQ